MCGGGVHQTDRQTDQECTGKDAAKSVSLYVFVCVLGREGCQVKGSQVKGSQVKGSQVKGSQVEGSQVKGSQVKVKQGRGPEGRERADGRSTSRRSESAGERKREPCRAG